MSFHYKIDRNDPFPYQVYDSTDWDETIKSKFKHEKEALVYCRFRNSRYGMDEHDESGERRW